METLRLENKYLLVDIIPELGGRIDSFINKETKKQWVWKNPKLKNKKVPKGSNYDINWQGGWEELYPNDAIEIFSWGSGFDHGELWNHEWIVKDLTSNRVDLKTDDLKSGSQINKLIYLEGKKLITSYNLNILHKEYYLFKLHIAIPLDCELDIKGDFGKIKKVDSQFGNILKSNESINFFHLQKNSGKFDFAYVENKKNSLIISDKKNSIEISYDKDFFEFFWIFQTQGGWYDHNVVVIEPCSNGKKDFSKAIKEKSIRKGPEKINTFYSVEII